MNLEKKYFNMNVCDDFLEIHGSATLKTYYHPIYMLRGPSGDIGGKITNKWPRNNKMWKRVNKPWLRDCTTCERDRLVVATFRSFVGFKCFCENDRYH